MTTITRNVVMHGGHTDWQPLGTEGESVIRQMMKDVAEHEFKTYASLRPQCVFDDPEIWIQEDILGLTMRGEWRATAFVCWR